MTFSEAYDKHSDAEFLEFARVKDKLSKRADLHAFILLDKLVPGKQDIVSAAEHDEIWLEVSPEELDNVASEEQMIDLIRAGVRYDSDIGSLALFV